MLPDISIKVASRLDYSSSGDFIEEVSALLTKEGDSVSIDFEVTEYIDSIALGMLLLVRDKAKVLNKKVSIINAKGAVLQVLRIANFCKLFSINGSCH